MQTGERRSSGGRSRHIDPCSAVKLGLQLDITKKWRWRAYGTARPGEQARYEGFHQRASTLHVPVHSVPSFRSLRICRRRGLGKKRPMQTIVALLRLLTMNCMNRPFVRGHPLPGTRKTSHHRLLADNQIIKSQRLTTSSNPSFTSLRREAKLTHPTNALSRLR